MNTFGFENITSLIGDAFGHTVGDPIFGGIILVCFFLASIMLLRLPLDVAVVVLVPLVFLLGSSAFYGAVMIPESVTGIAIIIMGVIAGWFFLRFALRW